MKRMLVNATQPEEVRVALVDGQRLYDLDIDNSVKEQNKGNIYKAKVTRVERSLEAAFVDYGGERHGFLPLKEIARSNFDRKNGRSGGGGRPSIQEVIHEGQELVVQVEKEERGNKGAALTTFLSLAARYLVLMPNNPRAGGISRRIDGDERDALRDALSKLDIPEGMGVIVRTAGIGRSAEELQSDLEFLLQLNETILDAAENAPAKALLYQDNTVVTRAIRDCLRSDIGEVLVDGQGAFDEARQLIDQVMPTYRDRVKFYGDPIPLFSRYQIESQIETAFQHEVSLPSGGSVVIDPTEALVSIDINSARATKGSDIEETALNTNLEAAEEVARQLRLRDVGGLIVIDFIDMVAPKNQRAVENKMRDALAADRARVQVGKISRFGLMEMSRQRLRPSLQEMTTEVCPRCTGQGRIRDVKSLAFTILRVVEEECMKERSSIVRALVPATAAAYLLNEKRQQVAEIEKRTKTHVVIVPSNHLETPHYEIQRIRDDNVVDEETESFELVEPTPETELIDDSQTDARRKQQPVVNVAAIAEQTPRPAPKPEAQAEARQAQAKAPESKGLISRLWGAITGTEEPNAAPETAPSPSRSNRGRQEPGRSRRRGNQQRDSRDANESRGNGRQRGGRGRGGSRDGERNRSRQDDNRSRDRQQDDNRSRDRQQDDNRSRDRQQDDNRSRDRQQDGGRDSRRQRGGRDRDDAQATKPNRARSERSGRNDRPEQDSEAKPRQRDTDRSAPDVANSKRMPRRDRSAVQRGEQAAKTPPVDPTGPVVEPKGDEAASQRPPRSTPRSGASNPVADDAGVNTPASATADTSAPDSPKTSAPNAAADGAVATPAARASAPASSTPAREQGRASNDPRARRRAEAARAASESALVTPPKAEDSADEAKTPVTAEDESSARATADEAAPSDSVSSTAQVEESVTAQVDEPTTGEAPDNTADASADSKPVVGAAEASSETSDTASSDTSDAASSDASDAATAEVADRQPEAEAAAPADAESTSAAQDPEAVAAVEESPAEPIAEQGRASNDPREVRRQKLEAEANQG